ncbi:MAG TPA: NUDIX domain-containing protein [Patescibacteria group bacterium]|nr:NUDIX domain-containing protein [Patescibacteria group bacterium]
MKIDKKHPEPVVSAFIFNNKNELFLVRGTKWQNQYLIPGGHLEYGETLEDCCRREVKEETGLRLKDLKFFTYQDGIKPKDYSKKDIHFVYLYFTARAVNNKVILDAREGKNHVWLKTQDAIKLKNIHQGIKLLIKKLIEQGF